jgi:hypothetical protein
MFKILGLLCLSTAYALSVMYLQGVKLSDTQVNVWQPGRRAARDTTARRGRSLQVFLRAHGVEVCACVRAYVTHF